MTDSVLLMKGVAIQFSHHILHQQNRIKYCNKLHEQRPKSTCLTSSDLIQKIFPNQLHMLSNCEISLVMKPHLIPINHQQVFINQNENVLHSQGSFSCDYSMPLVCYIDR